MHRILEIERLQAAFAEIHKSVDEKDLKSITEAIRRHNIKTNLQPVNFSVEDFVVVRNAKSGRHKLPYMWKGPARVCEVSSPSEFLVEDLCSGRKLHVHARRLKLFKAALEGTEVTENDLDILRHVDTHFEKVKTLKDIQEGEGLFILVESCGLPDASDYTWEPLAQLFSDMPGLVQDFLCTAGKRKLKKMAESFCQMVSSA